MAGGVTFLAWTQVNYCKDKPLLVVQNSRQDTFLVMRQKWFSFGQSMKDTTKTQDVHKVVSFIMIPIIQSYPSVPSPRIASTGSHSLPIP
jgi:hypothetical protein